MAVSEHRDGARSQQLEQDHHIGASDADDFTNSTSSIGLDPKEAAGTNTGQSSYPVDQELTRRCGADAGEQGAKRNPCLLDEILDATVTRTQPPLQLSVWMRTVDGDEYTGPSSGISTISDVGLEWIRQNVPDSQTLCSSILDIRNSVLHHLRQPKCVPHESSSAPRSSQTLKPISESHTSEYVDAYFTTVQTLFPILDRAVFEKQLATHGILASENSDSWNTLLNAVLASGCRAALSDESAEAFQESGREAWGYFQNALYYESKMINFSADTLAVQALAVMTVFSQGLSSPQRLEFTLSSASARMAQSLALHQFAPPEWSLTDEEQSERNRVFWVVYCLDKTIALRCGRPPVLNDNDISCPFPHGAVQVLHNERNATGNGHEVDVLLCAVKIARVCGMITNKLYSVSGLGLPLSDLQLAAVGILESLESWRTSLPSSMRPGKQIGRIRGLSHTAQMQLLVIHSTYYYTLCAVYRRFTPMFTKDGKDSRDFVSQLAPVSHIESARSIILLTKFFDIESFTPGWLVFYYPFTALTTLFLNVVERPSEESARDDIALMETVVGFFGRLEYITSGEAAFTKTTDFVRQARHAVTRMSIDATVPQRPETSEGSDPVIRPSQEARNCQEDERMTDYSSGSPTVNGRGLAGEGLGSPVLVSITPFLAANDHGRAGEVHESQIPTSFPPHESAFSLASDEILGESWLQDWTLPGENAPLAS
ncbi:hypothetical protein NM208_g12361 [Fusarium decemcellulare]|uniref:Uncharacterized protein n=1 Tax=Fusarium decemcellulare TaxID=57161 RepID=A0ACC1RRJ8_9HYPO|nr:hypothetical protein NM208_g12361 [Fusarium decemcellulare]